MTQEQQSRPGGRSQAAESSHGSVISLAELDDLALHVRGTFVVVVERRIDGEPHVLRRPYLTAAAAERAARNALDRGQKVHVYLATLVPAYRLEVRR